MPYATQDRLTELCRSLDEIIQRTDNLEHEARDANAATGCSARFTSLRGAWSVLDISAAGVTVTTRSAEAHPEAGQAEIVDRLGVQLADGYEWDDVSCGSSDELVRLLVKHMVRRTGHAPPDPGA
jgi:hypothetical protein